LIISRGRSLGALLRKSAMPYSLTRILTSCSLWSTWEHMGTKLEIAPPLAVEVVKKTEK